MVEMLQSRVSLSFSCQNLADLDFAGKSDPMVVVYLQDHTGGLVEVGRTETLKDNLNPEFLTPVVIDYKFEEPQLMQLAVFDVDSTSNKSLDAQELIGRANVRVASIVTASNSTWTGPLVNNKGVTRGTIKCKADELVESKHILNMQFAGEKLESKDFFSKSDGFLVFSRVRADGTSVPIHETERIDDDASPIWKPFSVSMSQLCNANPAAPILVTCYDWDSPTERELIGQCTITAGDLVNPNGTHNWALINPSKKKNGGISGTLKLLQCSVTANYSFLDYVIGGCEVSLVASVDFTASNGPVSDPRSLHSVVPGKHNQYEAALGSVSSVLAPYDADGRFQLMGFGAKINGQPNHCFGITSAEGVVGVDGLLQAYREFLPTVELWGPTNFAPMIRSASAMASQYQTQQNQKYFVLLILTDGVITDLDETKLAIIEASRLPLSIVIVGVGPADFTNMNALDSDKSFLSFGGQTAARDIVQFVPFRDFMSSPQGLASATLKEIPGQVLSFFKAVGFVPNPPKARS